jgi:hypothetical protein
VQTRSETKIVPQVDIEFVKFSANMFPGIGMGGFIQNVFFCHLFVTSCDDVDEYKNIVKRQIHDWMAAIPKNFQEWYVIHVGSVEKKGPSILGSLSRNISDRIRADFNPKK